MGLGWEPPVQGSLRAALLPLGSHTVTLKDVDEWQPLPLPKWSERAYRCPMCPAESAQLSAFLAVRIVSATPGTQDEDTCIAEIRASGG